MHYRSVFAKSYLRGRDTKACKRRGREPGNCPADKIVNTVLKPVYGPILEFSACESSASLITRPDPLFSVFQRRATRQVHIFEKAGPLGTYDSMIGTLDIRCASRREMSDLQVPREWEKATFCASGYLRPPTYMSFGSGYSLPLLNFYSSHIGLFPFLCTPYMSHHNFFGYLCAQAAIYLSLEMSLPLGGAPQSPATLSHMASCVMSDELWRPPVRPLLCKDHKHHSQAKPANGYFCGGLSVNEITALLDDERLQTQGLEFHADQMGFDKNESTERHIRFMLDSCIPLIAVVDFDSIARFVLKRSLSLDQGGAHVITIIGYKTGLTNRETKIVFHDGHLGPYREVELSEFVIAACNAPNVYGYENKSILLFSPLPRKVSTDGYLDIFQIAGLHEDLYKHSIRLCSITQLVQYLTRYTRSHLIFRPETTIEWLRQRLVEMGINDPEDSYPIWITEYIDRKTDSVFIDLIDATRNDFERRLGVVYLGQNPEEDPWEIVRTKPHLGEKFADEVKRATKEEKTIIKRV